jgi:hypothetical protein
MTAAKKSSKDETQLTRASSKNRLPATISLIEFA